MRSRGLIVGMAFVLAASATMATFLYIRGVKEQAQTGGTMTQVIVSQQDIPAGTQLDPLLEGGVFTETTLPKGSLVAGVVTDLKQLKGHETASPILAGEQISTARLVGFNSLPGGTLGIPEGHQAVSFSFDGPRSVAGNVMAGDHVTIYATVQALPGSETNGAATLTVVPDVEVLQAGLGEEGNGGMITFALKPEDAEKVIFASEQASLHLALNAPDEKAEHLAPVTIGRLVP